MSGKIRPSTTSTQVLEVHTDSECDGGLSSGQTHYRRRKRRARPVSKTQSLYSFASIGQSKDEHYAEPAVSFSNDPELLKKSNKSASVHVCDGETRLESETRISARADNAGGSESHIETHSRLRSSIVSLLTKFGSKSRRTSDNSLGQDAGEISENSRGRSLSQIAAAKIFRAFSYVGKADHVDDVLSGAHPSIDLEPPICVAVTIINFRFAFFLFSKRTTNTSQR